MLQTFPSLVALAAGSLWLENIREPTSRPVCPTRYMSSKKPLDKVAPLRCAHSGSGRALAITFARERAIVIRLCRFQPKPVRGSKNAGSIAARVAPKFKATLHAVQLLAITLLTLAGLVASTLAQEVAVPDPGLNAAIRAALQKPAGPLTEPDLENVLLCVMFSSSEICCLSQA